MRLPDSLNTLLDHGVLDDVIRPLMSGKEAHVYLVVSGGEGRVAKVYKEAQDRTFQSRAEYTEGRRVRNTRDQRAMQKRSGYGRAQDEAAWRSTEVDMIYRLRDAGVRVPEPYHFIDGVLIMELVKGLDGAPAPRLADVTFTRDEAVRIFERLLAEVIRMLCAGVVHGDLSDFNVLMAADGPVVIDFPQAVNAARNQNARKLLLRDVDNLQHFVQRFAPGRRALPYAQEMWALYERGELTPTTQLTGHYVAPIGRADTHAVLGLVADANHDERRRRQALGQSMRGMPSSEHTVHRAGAPSRPHEQPSRGPSIPKSPTNPGNPQGERAPGTRRRRRRRRGRGRGPGQHHPQAPPKSNAS
jgi:RIO kinase 1